MFDSFVCSVSLFASSLLHNSLRRALIGREWIKHVPSKSLWHYLKAWDTAVYRWSASRMYSYFLCIFYFFTLNWLKQI